MLRKEQEKEIRFELDSIIKDLHLAWQELDNARLAAELAAQRLEVTNSLYKAEPTVDRLLQVATAQVAITTALSHVLALSGDYRSRELEFFHARGDLMQNHGIWLVETMLADW